VNQVPKVKHADAGRVSSGMKPDTGGAFRVLAVTTRVQTLHSNLRAAAS